MVAQAFMSYSWKDIPIAVRIYTDLIRSGLKVWRDEFSADHGRVYAIEISNALKKCDGFMLLDSPNSRTSKYVKDECQSLNAIEKTGIKKIAICLVGNFTETRSLPELFDGQNLIKHFDFSNHTLFDNERTYFSAITSLCDFFGFQFKSQYPDSSQKDFEDEISTCKTKDVDRKILLEEFELIQRRINENFPNTSKRLQVFIEDCKLIGVECPSPKLQLAIELAKTNDFISSRDVLNEYTFAYPDDPRGFRCMGSVLTELQEFQLSLAAFEKALELTEQIAAGNASKIRFNSKRNLEHILDLKINRATALLNLGKQESIEEYEKVLLDPQFEAKLIAEHFTLLATGCDLFGLAAKKAKWIANGLKKFPGNCQLNLAKGRLLIEQGKTQSAMVIYDYLVFKDIDDVEVYGEYLSLLSLSDKSRFQQVFEKATKISPQTNKEMYYAGYFYFLAGETTIANEFYKKSAYTDLPSYEKILK